MKLWMLKDADSCLQLLKFHYLCSGYKYRNKCIKTWREQAVYPISHLTAGCIAGSVHGFFAFAFSIFNHCTDYGTLEARKHLSAFLTLLMFSIHYLLQVYCFPCITLICKEIIITFTWTSMKATGNEFYKTRLLQKIHQRYIQGSHPHRGLQIEGSLNRRHTYYFRILNSAASDGSHQSCSYQNHDGFFCGVVFEKKFLKLKENEF